MDYDFQSEIYNDIGIAVVEQIGTAETQILVFVVRGEDGIDYSIRYLVEDGRHSRSLPAGHDVALTLFKLQSHIDTLPQDKQWTAMEYWLDHGEVNISFSYDWIDPDVPMWERTPAVFERYFPNAPLLSD